MATQVPPTPGQPPAPVPTPAPAPRPTPAGRRPSNVVPWIVAGIVGLIVFPLLAHKGCGKSPTTEVPGATAPTSVAVPTPTQVLSTPTPASTPAPVSVLSEEAMKALRGAAQVEVAASAKQVGMVVSESDIEKLADHVVQRAVAHVAAEAATARHDAGAEAFRSQAEWLKEDRNWLQTRYEGLLGAYKDLASQSRNTSANPAWEASRPGCGGAPASICEKLLQRR